MGEKHKEALATLHYGVQDNKGFLLLTGDVGTGKTTLINALRNGLGPDYIVANVTDPGFKKIEFFNFIGELFNLKKVSTKGEFLVHFTRFLHLAHNRNKTILLIIDEAQRISNELLDEIRVLSNIEKQSAKLINIFFIGQAEFNDILLESRHRALRQRITINYNIKPLNREETGKYIRYRLSVAGARKTLFSDASIKEIHKHSGGYPRLINIICDHALLTGFVKEQQRISGSIIKECANELSLPKLERDKDNRKIGSFLESGARRRWNFRAWAKRPRLTAVIIMILLLALLGSLYLQIWQPNNADQGIFISISRTSGRPSKEVAVSRFPVSRGNASEKGVGGGIPVGPMPAKIVNANGVKKKAMLDDASSDRASMLADHTLNQAPAVISEAGSSSGDELATPPSKAPIDIPLKPVVIRFGSESNDFSPEAYTKLDPIINAVRKVPGLRVVIRGYSDSQGNPRYNKKISEFRANIVKSYLMGKNISPERITAKGLGSERPVASNKSMDGRKANRRVEIELVQNMGAD